MGWRVGPMGTLPGTSVSLLLDLGRYAAGEGGRRLPDDVLHHARRAVVDWFGAVLAGGGRAPAAALLRALTPEGNPGAARIYPSRETADSRTAALVNGTAAHALEVDDIYRDALYHPGAPTVAAALATAQQRGATGATFLTAVVVGYEIGTRIGCAVNPGHYRHWHTTGTVGSLGAAAAAAVVLGLKAEATAHALATSATLAAGLRRAFDSGSQSKPLHAGRAAEAGVVSAFAAAGGITGALDILEADGGFGEATSDRCDWRTPFLDLGDSYHITRVTFKPHACCGHAFAAIDGLLAVMRQRRLEPLDIHAITVGTYRTALEVVGRRGAETVAEARFSLPLLLAAAAHDGAIGVDTFTDARLRDPALRSLAGRVVLREDPGAERAFPGRRSARVAVETVQGSVFEHVQPTRRGDPDEPLSDREIEQKYLGLAEPVTGPDEARSLLNRLWRVDSLDPEQLRAC